MLEDTGIVAKAIEELSREPRPGCPYSIPYYPEIDKSKIIIKSPEDWTICELSLYNARIAFLSDGSTWRNWSEETIDLHDPLSLTKLLVFIDIQYKKRKGKYLRFRLLRS